MHYKEAWTNGILIINNAGIILSLTEFNGSEVHFLFNIFELLVSKIIENEMISEAGEYKIGVGVIFLFDGYFQYFN